MIAAGGSYLEAIIAGAILGLLPVVLDIVGFGVILGRGTTAGTLAAAFGLSVIVFGTVLGAGIRKSQLETGAVRESALDRDPYDRAHGLQEPVGLGR